MARCDWVWRGRIGSAVLGTVGYGKAGTGRKGMAWRVEVRLGMVRLGQAGKEWRDAMRRGEVCCGLAGMDGRCKAGRGRLRKGRQVNHQKHKAMEYKFTIPGLYESKVTPEAAAVELNRIRNKFGILRPEFVVEESRRVDAVLHAIFQWNDAEAAELYRRTQARKLIDSIQAVITNDDITCTVRAFVSVRSSEEESRSYTPITEAIHDKEMYADLLDQARKDMQSFVTKYSQLSELNSVKAEMLKAINNVK